MPAAGSPISHQRSRPGDDHARPQRNQALPRGARPGTPSQSRQAERDPAGDHTTGPVDDHPSGKPARPWLTVIKDDHVPSRGRLRGQPRRPSALPGQPRQSIRARVSAFDDDRGEYRPCRKRATTAGSARQSAVTSPCPRWPARGRGPVGLNNSVQLRDLGVLIDQAAQERTPPDPCRGQLRH
jgi:hypothetical protein